MMKAKHFARRTSLAATVLLAIMLLLPGTAAAGTVEPQWSTSTYEKFTQGISKAVNAPANVIASGTSYKSISLTWEPCEGATGYAIYRWKMSNFNDRGLEGIWGPADGGVGLKEDGKVAETAAGKTEWVDTTIPANSSYVYHYKVCALDANSERGPASHFAPARVVDTLSSNASKNTSHPSLHSIESSIKIDAVTKTRRIVAPGLLTYKIKAQDDKGIAGVALGIGGGYYNQGSIHKMTLPAGEQEFEVTVPVPVNASGRCALWYAAVQDTDGNITLCNTRTGVIGESEVYIDAEFDVEFRGSLSNGNVASQLRAMDEGKTVVLTIDSTSKGILGKELLEAIQGTDKTLVVYANSSGTMQWIINGKDVTGEARNIDVTTKLSIVPGSEYGCDQSLIKLTFADNGILPFKTNFRVNSPVIARLYESSGKVLLYNLHESSSYGSFVNLETDKTKVISAEDESWCYVDLTHNSSYLLAGKTLKSPSKVRFSKNSYAVTCGARSFCVTAKQYGAGKIAYTTSKTSVAKISSSGRITVTGVGEAIITAKAAATADHAASSARCKITVLPKGTSITGLSKAKKALTVKWKRQPAQTTGYQIRYSTNSSMTRSKTATIGNARITVKKITKLAAKKKYYVQVRTYKTASGKRYYSAWSAKRAITTRK